MVLTPSKSVQKARWKIVARRLCNLVLIILVGYYLVSNISFMRPMRGIHDYDERLTAIARSAAPIIKQAKIYYAANHRYPSCDEMRTLVKDPLLLVFSQTTLGNSIWPSGFQCRGSWMYGYDSRGFELSYRLSVSQDLIYRFDGIEDAWRCNNENDVPDEQPILLETH